MIRNRCLVFSRLIYGFFHRIDPRGDYRINIVLAFSNRRTRGHAWVSRHGEDFPWRNRDFTSEELCLVGEEGVFRYHVILSDVIRFHSQTPL